MNKFIVIGLLSYLSLNSVAQKTSVILHNESSFGTNLITNLEIVGNEYIFPERIETSYLDTASNCITVQLRGLFMGGKLLNNNGDIVLYDLSNKSTKWTKGMNYQYNFIEQHNNFVFKTSVNKTYCLDFETGENLWKAKNTIAFVNPYLKIGIGYSPEGSYNITDDFEGVDLTTGKTIWKREINHYYGLNDIFMLNDTIAIVVSSGLHAINLKNGKGWDYYAKTGVPFMSYKKTEIRSNVIIDSSSIYFASKEKIARLDFNGHVLWTTTLPEDLTSNSHILFMDSTLFMINTGSAHLNYGQNKQGKPYIAAFDSNTGEKLFLKTVDDKRGKIIESIIEKDDILILFKDKIAKCSVLNGTLISDKSFDTGKYGELEGFISNRAFFKSDSIYKSLALSDSINRYVVTNKGKILVINDKLDVVSEYDKDQLYTYYLRYHNLRFLAKENKTIVIDKNNKIVANIDISRHSTKIGSKLYNVQEKKVVEIDLKQITQ